MHSTADWQICPMNSINSTRYMIATIYKVDHCNIPENVGALSALDFNSVLQGLHM